MSKLPKASSCAPHPPVYQPRPLYLSLPALWHDTYSAQCILSLFLAIFVSYQNTRTMLYLNKIGER